MIETRAGSELLMRIVVSQITLRCQKMLASVSAARPDPLHGSSLSSHRYPRTLLLLHIASTGSFSIVARATSSDDVICEGSRVGSRLIRVLRVEGPLLKVAKARRIVCKRSHSLVERHIGQVIRSATRYSGTTGLA